MVRSARSGRSLVHRNAPQAWLGWYASPDSPLPTGVPYSLLAMVNDDCLPNGTGKGVHPHEAARPTASPHQRHPTRKRLRRVHRHRPGRLILNAGRHRKGYAASDSTPEPAGWIDAHQRILSLERILLLSVDHWCGPAALKGSTSSERMLGVRVDRQAEATFEEPAKRGAQFLGTVGDVPGLDHEGGLRVVHRT